MRLIAAILIVTKCKDTEQLKLLPLERKRELAHFLEDRVPARLATIEEWNELLRVFMEAPPEEENEKAKEKLLSYLRVQPDNEKKSSKSKIKWWHFKNKQQKEGENI